MDALPSSGHRARPLKNCLSWLSQWLSERRLSDSLMVASERQISLWTQFIKLSVVNCNAISMLLWISTAAEISLRSCRFFIFHCFYLAQNLLSTKKSRTCRRPARSISTRWGKSIKSATCPRHHHHHHHPRISSRCKSWNKTSWPLCVTYYTTAVMSMTCCNLVHRCTVTVSTLKHFPCIFSVTEHYYTVYQLLVCIAAY